MLDLAKAPFDATDATLNPGMGACGACPHRTGNAPVLFEDIKNGNVCTVPACFLAKRNAALERRAQALAKEHGHKSILKIAVGWVTSNKDESIPPSDKQVYSNTGVCLIEPGTEREYTKPAMVVYCERSENVKVGQYVSVCTRAGYDGECKKHNGRTRSAHTARPKISSTVRANRRVENWKKEPLMVLLGRISKATVEAAKKVKINGTVLKQVLLLTSKRYSITFMAIGTARSGKRSASKPQPRRITAAGTGKRRWRSSPWVAPVEAGPDVLRAQLRRTCRLEDSGDGQDLKVNLEKISAETEKELARRTNEELARARRSEERRKQERGSASDTSSKAAATKEAALKAGKTARDSARRPAQATTRRSKASNLRPAVLSDDDLEMRHKRLDRGGAELRPITSV